MTDAAFAPDIAHHAALDARMAKAARAIRLLSLVSWPASEQQTFLAEFAHGRARLPAHEYPKHDFSEARREFAAIAAAAERKIAVVMGEATIPAKGRVSVKTDKGVEELTAPAIILATGAQAKWLGLPSEEKFKEINEANEVLSNPDNRKKYDKYGKDWKHAEQFEQAKSSGHPVHGAREIPLAIRITRSAVTILHLVKAVIIRISFPRCSGTAAAAGKPGSRARTFVQLCN